MYAQEDRRQQQFFWQFSIWACRCTLHPVLLVESRTLWTFGSKFLLPWASQMTLVVKNLTANAGDVKDMGSIPGSGRLSWRRKWQPTSVLLPGESHGERSLAGYSPTGCKKVRHKWSNLASTHVSTPLAPSLLGCGLVITVFLHQRPQILCYGTADFYSKGPQLLGSNASWPEVELMK